MDLHRNMFYSYRGASTDSVDRNRQLENNLTKALINTLELGGKAVLQPILAELGITNPSDVKFLLQRRDLPSRRAASKRHRIILGISQRKTEWSPSARRETGYESLPDAWIYGETFAVLVESKMKCAFSQGQIDAHRARLWRSGATKPREVLKTWEEIRGLFRRILDSLTNERSRLLVEQFIQFLEYSGMTGFTGFRPDHFDYFVLHDDDDARHWVVDQMKDFAAQVLNGLGKALPPDAKSFYESFDVGQLKQDATYCWVAFGPANQKYRSKTHQSLLLRADGVAVFVNTELKAAADRLKKVLRKSPNALREAVIKMHDEVEQFELVIQERVQRQPRVIDFYPLLRINSWMLADGATADIAWRAFQETIQALPLPSLGIEFLIPRKELVELSNGNSSKPVEFVAECIKRNHAIVKMLNE